MLKKKNIAMVMAAATVATSVAPVFAASLDGETVSTKDSAKLAQLKEEIKGYLDVKYTTDKSLLKVEALAGTPVYEVKIGVNKVADTKITSIKDLEKELVGLTKSTDTINITVEDTKNLDVAGTAAGTDKAAGHKIVDGKAVDCTVGKYKKSDIDALKTATAITLNAAVKNKVGAPDVVKGVDVGSDFIKVELLNNATPLVLKVGEDKTIVSKEAAIQDLKVIYKEDAFGNKLDKDGKITKVDTEYVAIGFDKYKDPLTADDKTAKKTFDIINKEVESSVEAKALFNMDLKKYTQEGNEIAKFIVAYNKIADPADKIADPVVSGDKLSLTLTVPKDKEGLTSKFSKLTVRGTVNEIAALEAALKGTIAGTGAGVEISTLAGQDREATAIEVSKATFADNSDAAQNIVLVSGTSIADGLTATPFAKAKKAPVLLTASDKISEQVMKEIKRVKGANGKVYLVGGTNSLKTSIEDQLDSQFIKYERIAGADRADTSLKVAKKMEATSNELFVTGGYAEADSMSVAAVAAQKTAPILLAGESGLTREQSKFVSDKATSAIFNKTYVVGGTSKVSTDVEKSLSSLVKGDVTRLAGDDRQGTNAKVISAFYPVVTNLHVAKAGDKGLVDALATGVLAAKDAVSPVVLVGETLSSDQKAVLTKNSYNSAAGKKVQIGYGIADKVWEAINKIK